MAQHWPRMRRMKRTTSEVKDEAERRVARALQEQCG